MQVHVVNPGVIDTRLFQLPDNEPSMAASRRFPSTAMVEPVLETVDDGFEIYVPGWFADIVAGKYKDVGAFMEGTMAYARSQD